MKIEIWSDVMCPFCYIGKRNFETALEQFANKNRVEVIWKSYQLDAQLPDIATENYQNYLMRRKGRSADEVKGIFNNITQLAKKVGLEYHLEKSQIVNTFNAHKLMQFAKTKGLGDQMEERLFHAFFIEGKSIADVAVLSQLGKEIGLDEKELQAAFTDDMYANLVKQDISEAKQLGLRSVPFFVFDRKNAVSGSDSVPVFIENLEKSFSEWRKLNPETKLNITQGQSCDADGNCE